MSLLDKVTNKECTESSYICIGKEWLSHKALSISQILARKITRFGRGACMTLKGKRFCESFYLSESWRPSAQVIEKDRLFSIALSFFRDSRSHIQGIRDQNYGSMIRETER